MSVQEPELASLAGHVVANAQQGAVKDVVLMYQHALLLLAVHASTEQTTVYVVHARSAVIVPHWLRETQDQAQHKLPLL